MIGLRLKTNLIYNICRVPISTSGKQCCNNPNSTPTNNNKLITIYLINQKSVQIYNGRVISRKGCTWCVTVLLIKLTPQWLWSRDVSEVGTNPADSLCGEATTDRNLIANLSLSNRATLCALELYLEFLIFLNRKTNSSLFKVLTRWHRLGLRPHSPATIHETYLIRKCAKFYLRPQTDVYLSSSNIHRDTKHQIGILDLYFINLLINFLLSDVKFVHSFSRYSKMSEISTTEMYTVGFHGFEDSNHFLRDR